MHRMSACVLTAVLVLPMSMALAQQPPDGNTPSGGGKGMHAMMMGHKMGMHPTMIATSDGGVVILMGKKLVKYDKDLNLVKDVEFRGPAGKGADEPPADTTPGPDSGRP